MVKLKSIKKKLSHIKCCVLKVLAAKQPERKVPNVLSPNKIKPNLSTTSSAEGFIPLAAKDSQWVGLEFYNPHFRSPLDEEDDVEEDELASDDTDPIFLLFPGLKKTEKHDKSSTTEITKLLVGQKADLQVMKGSNKITSTDNKLSSVQEENNGSETDVSLSVPQKISTTGSCGNYEDEEDSEPVRATHTKRRKKKSDVKIVDLGTSSESLFIILPKRPPSKTLRQNSSVSQKKTVFGSPHPSFADEEGEDSKN